MANGEYFYTLLQAQIEGTSEALQLAHRALALARVHDDPAHAEALAALDRALATADHRVNAVREQLGLSVTHAVH